MKEPLLIDTHTHVNFNVFKDDGDQVIKRTLDQNVWMINVGSQYSTSRRAVEYANKYKQGVYAAVGLHPFHINKSIKEKEFEEFSRAKYEELLEDPKTVALGEIGLDYIDGISQESKDKQKAVLVEQIELAQRAGKPIVFHCRKAYEDLIELLTMFNLGCANCPQACSPGLRGVIHCFMGRLSQAEKFLELGFYISFNGIITYARDYDKVIEKIPLNRILLETDAPYLTPEPHRDERNEPLYVKYVAEKIAQIKKIDLDQVTKQTTENARMLFNI